MADPEGQYRRLGYLLLPDRLDADTLQRYSRLIEQARRQQRSPEMVSNATDVYALRNLTDLIPETRDLASLSVISRVVRALLGDGAFMVRATLFDKTPGANWGVFWHQDLSIAVQEKHHVEGFQAWTRKAGVHCVQPPADLMSQILAVRLHLDDCGLDNGALRVLPGSHLQRRLGAAAIDHVARNSEHVVCEAPAGGILLMNPLLLHASSPMERPGQRRVLHLEFAGFELPPPLQWRYRIPCRRCPSADD